MTNLMIINHIIKQIQAVSKWHQVGLSLFNYQDDARSNKHKISFYLQEKKVRVHYKEQSFYAV